MNQAIRILLIDENEPVRYGLRQMLEQAEGMKVVGDYASAEEASSELARLQADIVLMDAQMPGMGGIESARRLKKNGLSSNAGVILVTEGKGCRAEALEDGAADSLVRDWECTEITGVIREVYRNKQMQVVRGDSTEETVELVIAPPAESARLLKFLCQMEGVLGDYSGAIQQVAGSWRSGIVVTVSLQSITLGSLLDRLTGVPGIDAVGEEPLVEGNLPSLSSKFGILKGSGTSPSKRLHVVLKETGVAKQVLTPVMN